MSELQQKALLLQRDAQCTMSVKILLTNCCTAVQKHLKRHAVGE